MKLGEIAFERIKNWLKIGHLLYSDIIWGCMVCRFGSIGVPLQLMDNSRLPVFVGYQAVIKSPRHDCQSDF